MLSIFIKHGIITTEVRVLKTLEFQKSDFKALKVLEIDFGPWKSLIFLLKKIEKY